MNRRAFTLLELLVVLVMGGAIAAAVGEVLRRQQRFFTNAASLIEERGPLRDATAILPAELRALSPPGADVVAFSDSSLDLRATIGAGIACDTVAGGGGIDLAPAGSAAGVVLSAFATMPQPGDVAAIYDAGASESATDDAWASIEVDAAAVSLAACAASPFVDAAREAVSSALRLRFKGGVRLSPTVRPGAFVRVLRRVRYRFYRAAAGAWYLGYAEWDGAGFGVVQPVSGPFAPYDRRGASGLTLRYFDELGAELFAGDDAVRIARVEIVARGQPRAGLSGVARPRGDSQVVVVRPRNR